MNYLAHSFLSFSPEQLVGNFLADFERFEDKKDYPEEIAKGIALHHAIDQFTDSHEEFKKAKRLFSPLTGHYAAVFTDIAMDYFLATDPKIYSKKEWEEHCEKVIYLLEENYKWLPESLKKTLPSMRKYGWLAKYGSFEGIDNSIRNVLKRAKYLPQDLEVFSLFQSLIPQLQIHYDLFFPELFDFAKNWNENYSNSPKTEL